MLDLLLQSKVRVWCKKKRQQSPYKLITINSQTCTIQIPYRPSQFQLTVIKPYYKDNSSEPLQDILEDILDNILEDIPENIPEDILEDVLENVLKDILEDVLEENYN